MKYLTTLILLLNSFHVLSNEYIRGKELTACKVKIAPQSTLQNGLFYTHSTSVNADLEVYGPKDLNKSCNNTPHILIKKFPIRISARHAIGGSVVVMGVRSSHKISVTRWNGNSLNEILGNYTGLQAGLGFTLGFSLNTMVKMDLNSFINLSSANWEALGLKIDLSLVNFSLKKIASTPIINNEWNLILRRHQ